MNEPAPSKMTVSEFLAWAEAQPERPRYELVAGAPVAMAPERARHAETKGRVYRALDDAVRRAGLACQVFPDGMTVEVDSHTAYEPDVLLRCGDRLAGDAVIVPDPIVVVEITSPGTQSVDAGAKLIGYFQIPTIMHYLIVDPLRRAAVHHRRGDKGTVATAIVAGSPLVLEPPGLEIDSSQFFAPE